MLISYIEPEIEDKEERDNEDKDTELNEEKDRDKEDKNIELNEENEKKLELQLESADIMKNQHGSDHCPTYFDFVTPIPILPEHPPAALSSITHKTEQV